MQAELLLPGGLEMHYYEKGILPYAVEVTPTGGTNQDFVYALTAQDIVGLSITYVAPIDAWAEVTGQALMKSTAAHADIYLLIDQGGTDIKSDIHQHLDVDHWAKYTNIALVALTAGTSYTFKAQVLNSTDPNTVTVHGASLFTQLSLKVWSK